MATYQYLTKTNIFKRYQEAKRYTDLLTRPFPEFSRLSRNKPAPNIAPYPEVTDGTLSAIIEENSRKVVQQAPLGQVTSDKENDWLPIVADFIYRENILPYAKSDYDLLEKSQLVVKNACTFGSCATFDRFAQHDFGFGPDPELIYWGDLSIQKGKKSGDACNYLFYRVWWQKSDIEALIDSENKRSAKSKTYKASWDTKALQQIVDNYTQKDTQAITPTEFERGLESDGIELITGFQKGVGANFYTFNPESQLIVRTKVNNDPRGKMPINWCYCEIDGTNPLGRGLPEVVGSLQNFIDARMQMAGYASALGLAPPTIVIGEFNENVEWLPNAVFHAQTSASEIIPLNINTTALTDYTQTQTFLQSQMYQRAGGTHTNVSGSDGVVTDGKTPTALNLQQAQLDVNINTLTKHFEMWFEAWSEDAINRYFAEKAGKELLQLDASTGDRLRSLITEGFWKLDKAGMARLEKNQVIIDYDSATPVLRFQVDPATSRLKDNAAQLQDATTLLDTVMQFPVLNKMFGGPIDTDVLARRIVVNSGIENPEEVAPELTPAEIESKKLQANQVNPFSPFFDKPSVAISWEQLPPTAQLDLLRNAGSTSVTLQDIMNGPVANINARGNTALNKPLDDPSQLMPGGQSQVPPTQQSPVDLGDIYKQTTDPTVKAQIEAMAGLQPNLDHAVNQLQMQPKNPPLPPASQAQLPPVTMKHVQELRAQGVPDHVIAQAIQQYQGQGVPANV